MGTSKLSGKPNKMLGGYLRWGGVAILLVASETGISSGSNGPLGSQDLTLLNC